MYKWEFIIRVNTREHARRTVGFSRVQRCPSRAVEQWFFSFYFEGKYKLKMMNNFFWFSRKLGKSGRHWYCAQADKIIAALALHVKYRHFFRPEHGWLKIYQLEFLPEKSYNQRFALLIMLLLLSVASLRTLRLLDGWSVVCLVGWLVFRFLKGR